MEASKLVLFTLFLAAIGVCAEDVISGVQDEPGSDGQDLGVILEQLKSKIRSLEYHIELKTRELKDKDAVIAAKEKIINENSDSIVSSEGEIASSEEKGDSDGVEQVAEARARAGSLEDQVDKLNTDLDMQIKEKKQLEKKESESNLKADNFHRAWFPPWLAGRLIYYQGVMEMNWKVHGKPALESLMHKKKAVAEEGAAHVEIVKSKWAPTIKEKWAVITSKAKPHLQALTAKASEIYAASKNAVTPQFIKVPQLVVPYFQELRRKEKSLAITSNAKPLLQALTAKTSEIYTAFEKVVTLHFSKVVELVFPYFQELRRKENWVVITGNAKPYTQALKVKTSEIYEAAKNAFTLHFIKVVELVDPYFQELRRKVKWAAITSSTKPHLQALTEKTSETYEAPKNVVTPQFIKELRSKETWIAIIRNIKPHLKALTTKASEIYEAAKKASTLLSIKVVELVDPYFQELIRVIKSCWSMWMERNR